MNQELSISVNQKIKEALKVIDSNSKGAIAVVADDGTFLRLLTDGDIRRLLIDGNSIDTPLSQLSMDRNSITVDKDTDSQSAKLLMDEKQIDHLVYLDENQKVVDLKHRRDMSPILLSSPHMGRDELKYVEEAFSTNWIAPLGPNVTKFEDLICEITGAKYAVAVSSGTAAIHLALINLGVAKDDVVLCSSLTFVASCNPIMYQQATPVFVDSEPNTWNMCPTALRNSLESLKSRGIKPKAIIVVNLYGQSADMDSLVAICKEYDVPMVEDAAESLGAYYKGKSSGTFGDFGVYSFNGNKIITTSGGGMLVSESKEMIEKALFLATQARDPAPYYLHTHIGYNYRMSNVLAGIGRGQLNVLEDRVNRRREIYQVYVDQLSGIPELEFMPEVDGHFSNRWLTAAVLNPQKTDKSASDLIKFLSKSNIESRHVWKPMHTQPMFADNEYFTAGDFSVSDYLFDHGLCLPSGSNLSASEQQRVIDGIKAFLL